MKTQLLKLITGTSLCSLFFFPCSSFAQVPSYVPTNGLVAWWPFNGNAYDESGNGNNGTVNGATLTSDRNGLSNSAYYFSGSGCATRIDVPLNVNQISNGLTLSYWALQSGNGCVAPRIMEFYANGDAPGTLSTQNWNNYWQIVHRLSNNTGINLSANPTPPNTWFQLTYTNDGSTAKLYQNGVLVASASVTGNPILSSNLAIGRMNHPAYDAHEGNIDDIGIWNRALTQQEITDLYNAQTCTNPTASITPQSNTTFCQGGSVVLQATVGATYTYEWYKNGVLINGANQSSYSATTSGNYTVKVIDGSCNATSAATTVTVNPYPSVSINSIGSITNYYAASLTLSGSPAGGTFSGLGVSGNSFNPQQAGLGTQTISYSYTNASNCSGLASTSTLVYDTLGTVCTSYDTLYTTVTDTLIINTTLSLAPPNDQNTILIYPNPASDHITIDNGNYSAMSGYSLKITNNTGQQVFQSPINQPQFYLDLSTWSGNGLYYVHLIDPQGVTVTLRKIVLQ